MRIRTTSTQRTYRYVRLTILAATLLLAVAVAVEEITGGPLPSLSAAYYTPAGPMFVAGLCVVAAAFADPSLAVVRDAVRRESSPSWSTTVSPWHPSSSSGRSRAWCCRSCRARCRGVWS